MSPSVLYLSSDALTEGVGASQVLAYVERLPSLGIGVDLHTFEKSDPPTEIDERLRAAGVAWHPHPFGRYGAAGGIGRIVRGARFARGATIVHARADLAAASALLARPDHLVWDCRGLFTDQRLALGTLRAGTPEHALLRRVERSAARRSDAIVTLTHAVVPVLEQRHGPGIGEKVTVIPTCVDLERFSPHPMPDGPVRLLLAGTINRYYDVPLMLRVVEAVRRSLPADLVLATPGPTAWEHELRHAAQRTSVPPSAMPALVASCHAGLSVCREDAGVSLTGSMPTKLAEFLAGGRPIVVNRSLGDAAAIVRDQGCGVVVEGDDDDDVARAAGGILELVSDPSVPQRCREVAERTFDVDRAVESLAAIYRTICA